MPPTYLNEKFVYAEEKFERMIAENLPPTELYVDASTGTLKEIVK